MHIGLGLDVKVTKNDEDSPKEATSYQFNLCSKKELDQLSIKCPLCELEVTKDFIQKEGVKALDVLCTCNNCNRKILHHSRPRYFGKIGICKASDKVIAYGEYNKLSEQMIKIEE